MAVTIKNITNEAKPILSLLSSTSDLQMPRQQIKVLRGTLLDRKLSAPPSSSL